MTSSALRALPFEQEEPFRYLGVDRPGFASVLRKMGDGRLRQHSFWLGELPHQLEQYNGMEDAWISQCEFYRPNRRIVNLWRMQLAFADLDTYKLETLRGLSPEALTDKLLLHCDDSGLPPPSIVVYSGRGLQAKWLFTEPLPRAALPRWQAVQLALNEALADLGADANAMDASRVLRLVGTRSSRSGDIVRVVHVAGTPTHGGELMSNGAVGYDFGVFADNLLPYTRAEIAAFREQRLAQRKGPKEGGERFARKPKLALVRGGKSEGANERSPLIPSELAWARLSDLQTLAHLRGHGDGLPPGQRNQFIFLGACFLADACVVPKLLPEVVELGRKFAPTWSNAQLMSCVSAVISRAEAAATGQTVSYGDIEVDPKYRWKNETLVERLVITAAEERQLKTIMSHSEAQRRNTEQHRSARRANGVIPRASYLEVSEERRRQARQYRDAGWELKAIAERLNVNVSTVSRYCKP